MEHPFKVIDHICEKKGVTPSQVLKRLVLILLESHGVNAMAARGQEPDFVQEIVRMRDLYGIEEVPRSVMAAVEVLVRGREAMDRFGVNDAKAKNHSAEGDKLLAIDGALLMILRELMNRADFQSVAMDVELDRCTGPDGRIDLNKFGAPDDESKDDHKPAEGETEMARLTVTVIGPLADRAMEGNVHVIPDDIQRSLYETFYDELSNATVNPLNIQNTIEPFNPYLLQFHRFGSAGYFEVLRVADDSRNAELNAVGLVVTGRDPAADGQALQMLVDRRDGDGNPFPNVDQVRQKMTEVRKRPLLVLLAWADHVVADPAIRLLATSASMAFTRVIRM